MDLFLGLDLSLTCTGVVILTDTIHTNKSDDIVFQGTLDPASYKEEIRLGYLYTSLKGILEKHPIRFAGVEGAAYQKEGRLYELGQWAGVVYLLFWEFSIPFIEITPSQVKKYLTGKGAGSKSTILLDIYKIHGIEFRNDNIADAYGVCLAARDYFLNTPSYNYQKEVIASLKKRYNKKTLI